MFWKAGLPVPSQNTIQTRRVATHPDQLLEKRVQGACIDVGLCVCASRSGVCRGRSAGQTMMALSTARIQCVPCP